MARIVETLKNAGFKHEDTGGGMIALVYEDSEGRRIMATDSDGGAYPTDVDCLLGLYPSWNGDQIAELNPLMVYDAAPTIAAAKALLATFGTRAERIAESFACYLRNELGQKAWDEMRAANRTTEADACASHDYCDANMSMHEAFAEITGRDPIAGPMSDDDIAVWNDAWAIAKKRFLTADS